MTSTTIRKLMVAGACVAALGLVACKPKPAADTTAASDAMAASAAPADSSAMAAAPADSSAMAASAAPASE